MAADRIRIAGNLGRIRDRIESACRRSGRSQSDVKLIAVTKTVGLNEIAILRELGVNDFGENRVVPALEKATAMDGKGIDWHFIGHLQRNKAAKVLPYFTRIHSLESEQLAEILSAKCLEQKIKAKVFIEVNTSGEGSKYGISPNELTAFANRIARFDGIEVKGLMTMAPFTSEPETARPFFRKLRELRDSLTSSGMSSVRHLSMGMSGDFEVAIEEGATHVRIGSALFE